MLYKACLFYSLSEPLDLTDIETKLEGYKSKEPSRHALESIGFYSPFDEEDGQMVHSVQENHSFCLRLFKKNIPPALVNYLFAERKKKIEKQSGEPIGKAMGKQLKDEIRNELASNMRAVPSYIFATYLAKHNLIAINVSAFAKAETFLALLRKAIGSVPVTPFFNRDISSDLTDWVFEDGSMPDAFELMDKGTLVSQDEEKSESSFKRQDMDAEEVIASRDAGKVIKEIALNFEGHFTFIITEQGIIKSIKWTDLKLESLSEIPKDQVAAVRDAGLVLNAESLSDFADILKNNCLSLNRIICSVLLLCVLNATLKLKSASNKSH